jgi:preprotein translocase subunit SecG
MSIPVVLWLLILVALGAVYAYRKMVAGSSDELVHLSDATDAVLAKQEATARTIQQLDRMVLVLAIVFVVYGVILGALQIYLAFNSSSPGA